MTTYRKPYSVLQAETANWSILDWLDQETIWRDNEGRFLYMEDFETTHLENLIGWLEERARRFQRMAIARAFSLYTWPMHDDAMASLDREIEQLQALTPKAWLQRQPLYMALVGELQARIYRDSVATPSGYGPSQVMAVRHGRVELPSSAHVYRAHTGDRIDMSLSDYVKMVRR